MGSRQGVCSSPTTAALVLLGVMCSAVTAAGRIILDFRTEFETYPAEESEVRMQVRIRTNDLITGQVPVGLSLVIDTSGSLAVKIGLVKNISSLILRDGAANGDAIGVVTFSTEAQEISPFRERDASDADTLLEAVEGIEAAGSTNLAGGLFLGLEQIKGAQDTLARCRTQEVFLFSDGEPNAGVTSDEEILQGMRERLGDEVRVTTFPATDQTDYNLLQDIAKIGGGEAYPMSNLDHLADAFSMAQLRLHTVVGQNITLILRPLNGARITDLRSPGIVEEVDESMSRITIPSLSLDEQRIPFVQLKIPPSGAGLQDVMQIEMEYEDTEDCRNVVAESRTVSIQRVSEPGRTVAGDLEVLEARWRFQVATAFENATDSMESGNPQRAADFLAAISDEVVDTAVFGRSEFLQGYSNGSRGLAATLRELQEPGIFDTALVRELCDSMLKESTSLPSLDEESFGFLQFFDTPSLKEARARANQMIGS